MALEGSLRPVLVRLLEGRVGSTLLMQLLATAPEVAFDRVYPFENSYLTYLTRLVGQIDASRPAGGDMVELLYGDPSRIGPLPFDPETLDRPGFARDSLQAVWGAFCRAMPAAASAQLYAEKYWGDVTPVIAAGLDPIVVDLMRDPRDVVASVRAFNAQTGRQRFGRAQAQDDAQHLKRMLAGMRFRLREFARPLPVAQLVIRYEDLVADLPAEADRLATALGVGLDAHQVNQARAALARHMTSESPEASVGRWARDLTADEVASIERTLGPQMVSLGYSPAT